MNYLQRMSAALTAWEKRHRSRRASDPEPCAGQEQDPDWLSRVQAVARRLPARPGRAAGVDD